MFSLTAISLIAVVRARTRLLVNLLALWAVNLTVYGVQLSGSNAYMGFQPLAIDVTYLVVSLGSLAVLSAVMPVSIVRPSDYFGLFYGLFVAASYAILHPVVGRPSVAVYALQFAILLVPLVFNWSLATSSIKLRLASTLGDRSIERFVLVICLAGTAAAYANSPESAGFSLEAAYDRRLEGREIFLAGSPLAYLISIISNGLLPFLAFIAGLRRRPAYFACSLLMGIVIYYVIGIKAHLMYIALALVVGHSAVRWGEKAFHRFLFACIWALFAIFIVERFFWDLTLTGELFFRRSFAVSAQVISLYYDFVFGEHYSLWTPLVGATAPEGISFLIGGLYFGLDTANVNTNAFTYALAASGILGFCGTVVLTSCIFAFLDCCYRGTSNRGFQYLGFAYSLLLTEQAATTALVSSGIGTMVVLVCLASRGWSVNIQHGITDCRTGNSGHSKQTA